MPRFFDELKGKAQSAINATPLGAYVPGLDHHGGAQSASSSQGSQGPQSGGRSLALGTLQHQFRSLQVQYGSGTSKDLRQLQLVITGQKGIVLDLEKQAQDAKSVSKDFYIWGQGEDSDVKDVSDRLAYLTYVQGSLAATLASSLDATRAPLKALRDAESHIQPKRNLRLGYELQISRLKNEAKPGTEQKLREVETLLKQAEVEDEPLEKEIELLKRKAIIDSETQKWQALREYGEKLVLLSQACAPLVGALHSVPPTTAHPYSGAASTAATRAALQKAMDNYKPGNITLPAASSSDQETRSFGETHASELGRISSVSDHSHHATPASPGLPQSPSEHGLPPQPTAVSLAAVPSQPTGTRPSVTFAPVNPNELNNAPAPIPNSPAVPTPATTSPQPQSAVSSEAIAANTPTVAETGIPVAAGNFGPGPASGSLAGGRQGSQGTAGGPTGPGYGEAAPSYGGAVTPKYGLNDAGAPARYESAEDEKNRLEKEARDRLLQNSTPPSSLQLPSTSSPTSTTHESAEDEKKRLEREERERVLRLASSGGDPPSPGPDSGDGSVPPPYTEPR